MNYNIVLAKIGDIKSYHDIIVSRCKWLEDNGVNQWKPWSYPIRYSIQYFEEQININRLFVIKDDDNKIYGGFLLKERDENYWDDSNNVSAFYIHHLATKIGGAKFGEMIFDFCIDYSKKNNKEYLRLDCVAHNDKLNAYYKKIGFKHCGTIQIKNWSENLWQIKL